MTISLFFDGTFLHIVLKSVFFRHWAPPLSWRSNTRKRTFFISVREKLSVGVADLFFSLSFEKIAQNRSKILFYSFEASTWHVIIDETIFVQECLQTSMNSEKMRSTSTEQEYESILLSFCTEISKGLKGFWQRRSRNSNKIFFDYFQEKVKYSKRSDNMTKSAAFT